jgi:hypothetical protein
MSQEAELLPVLTSTCVTEDERLDASMECRPSSYSGSCSKAHGRGGQRVTATPWSTAQWEIEVVFMSVQLRPAVTLSTKLMLLRASVVCTSADHGRGSQVLEHYYSSAFCRPPCHEGIRSAIKDDALEHVQT